jgi:chemotaxis protein CheC
MTRDLNHLPELEMDALRELGNIGAGNAATALSQMMGLTFTITVPQVRIVPLSQVPELLGGEETLVAAVYMKVFGDAPAKILLFLTQESVAPILELMFQATNAQVDGLNEKEQSALKELGNIIGAAYLNSLAKFLNLQFIPSVPALAVDMVGSIMSDIMVELSVRAQYAVFIETEFTGRGKPIKGCFFMIPETDSLNTILDAILRPGGV